MDTITPRAATKNKKKAQRGITKNSIDKIFK